MPDLNPAAPWLMRTIAEGAQTVTIACVSSLTNEEGGITVRPSTTLTDVVDAYAAQFPRESAAFLAHVKAQNQQLANRAGMSRGRTMMKLAEIPEFILWAMRAVRRDYWDEPRRVYRFIRQFPAFMIGDHRKRETKGLIVR